MSDEAAGFTAIISVFAASLIVGELLRRAIVSPRFQRIYRISLIRVRRWWRTVKGPPPKKHGVIPHDTEPFGLPAELRAYLHDYQVSLRPGRPYVGLGEAVQLEPTPRIMDASRCCNCAGYKPVSLEQDNYD